MEPASSSEACCHTSDRTGLISWQTHHRGIKKASKEASLVPSSDFSFAWCGLLLTLLGLSQATSCYTCMFWVHFLAERLRFSTPVCLVLQWYGMMSMGLGMWAWFLCDLSKKNNKRSVPKRHYSDTIPCEYSHVAFMLLCVSFKPAPALRYTHSQLAHV